MRAKGLQVPACPPAPAATRDQAIDSGFCGFLRVPARGHVMKHQAAVAVYGVHDFLDRSQAGDDDRHFVLDADLQIGLQARIAVVHDQVHCVGGRVLQCAQPRLDLFEPGLEATAFALVQGREAADQAIATTGQDQFRVGDQEHRRRHQRQAQVLLEQNGQ